MDVPVPQVMQQLSRLPKLSRKNVLLTGFVNVVDVSVPKVVEQPFVVPRNSSQTESCSVPWSRFFPVPVPRTIEQFVEVPKVVVQDRIQQRTLEQITDTPVPQYERFAVGCSALCFLVQRRTLVFVRDRRTDFANDTDGQRSSNVLADSSTF